MNSINQLAERAYLCALRRGKTRNGFISHDESVSSMAEEFSEFVLADEYRRSVHVPDVSETAEELADILIVSLTELYRRDINVEKLLFSKMEFNEQRT